MKKILLDTFCKAGGAGMGYHQAGFQVVGVDIAPQKNYPFEFIQADAVQFILDHGHQFDAIHASPPCQAHSKAGKACMVTIGKEYPDLIPDTRQALEAIGKPYVIENVPFSGIRPDLKLKGIAFGLPIIRERWFEVGGGIWLMCPIMPLEKRQVSTGELVTVAGSGSTKTRRRRGDKMVYENNIAFWQGSIVKTWQYAMGIDWMTNSAELANAIPPAYTEYIGRMILEQLNLKNERNYNNPHAAPVAAAHH